MYDRATGGATAVPVAQAALALHEPDLGVDEILRRLVDLAGQVGPAGSVVLVPPDTLAPEGLRTIGVPEAGLLAFTGDDEASERLEILASHAALAIANHRRAGEAERREVSVRRVAEQLQDALLPPPPELEHTLIAREYRAAGREARVGGDFYDVFPLPDGRVVVLIGDIVGKGIEAASRTTRITQTIRSLALGDLTLDELLHRTDEQVTYQDPDLMATVWCGYYTPATGELEFSSLGHPPALLLRGGGNAPIRLELHGLPLGMRDLAEEVPEIRSRRLEPGDMLVLYTDGVVETAGDFIAGQDQLLEAVQRRRDLPLAQLITSALDELLADADHLDDALMLLLRRR